MSVTIDMTDNKWWQMSENDHEQKMKKASSSNKKTQT